MASELKVDKFTGVTTAGSISVTGEGNSTTTNLQQGLCKMWAKLDGSGTIGLDDSFNVGSITDEGTGEYSFTFSNNMNNANFNVAHASDNQMQIHRPSRTTTTSVGINCRNQNNTSEDRDHLFSNVHGDLA
tara:strand:- start:130 stop:522 length:393 start_codon:yes stop_codon:yes gene_type:complete